MKKVLRDGLALSDIVALNDAGQLDSLLSPITCGTCGWCRARSMVRDVSGSLGFLCQACFSMGIEIMRAAVVDDRNTCSALIKKLDSCKTVSDEVIH